MGNLKTQLFKAKCCAQIKKGAVKTIDLKRNLNINIYKINQKPFISSTNITLISPMTIDKSETCLFFICQKYLLF